MGDWTRVRGCAIPPCQHQHLPLHSPPPASLALQGAIIITGVLQLVEFEEAWYLWHTRQLTDLLVWVTAWLLTMFLVRRRQRGGW